MGLPRPSVMFVVLAVGLAGLLGVSPGATAGPDMSGSVARVAAVGTYRIGGVTDRWAKRLRNAIIYLLNHADCPYEVIGETCS